jgi:hypothetical protein
MILIYVSEEIFMSRYELAVSALLRTVFFTLLSKVSSLVKISFVLGSNATYFSLVGMSLPLAGVGRAGTIVATATAFIQLFYKIASSGVLPSLHLLAFIIPGWCAALYWAQPNIFRIALPLGCIALFIVHPVGFWALPYTFYWLVPIIFYLLKYDTLFATALGSTLTAHAVGSVIWLYTMPMTIMSWYTLMPLVAVERLLYAVGMVVMYSIGDRMTSFVKNYRPARTTVA